MTDRKTEVHALELLDYKRDVSEEIVMAQCIHDNSCLEQIEEEWFTTPLFRKIFRAIRDLNSAGYTADLTNIPERIGERPHEVAAITDAFGTGNFVYHADRLREAYQVNRLHEAVEQSLGAAREKGIAAAIGTLRTSLDDLEQPARGKLTFPLVRIGEIKARAPEYLVKGLIETDSFGMFFGDPAGGKTFIAVDLCCSIASGREFHGFAVSPGPVVYILGEGRNGIMRRFLAWAIKNQVSLDGLPLYLSEQPAALTDSGVMAQVISSVQAVSKESGNPALIVFDTLSRNFGPGNENDSLDMTLAISAADRLREQFRSTVLFIHHSGHGDKTRGRGNSALRGAVDFEFCITRDPDGLVRLESTKCKDAVPPEPLAFTLHAVELGLFDEDGQPVTSVVLNTASYQAPQAPKAARGKWQTQALSVLEAEIERHRRNVEADGRDPDTARVSVDAWRDVCINTGIPRNRFYEVSRALQAQSQITIQSGFVSLSGPVPCPVPYIYRETGQTGQPRTGQTGHKPDTNRTENRTIELLGKAGGLP